MSVRRAAIAVMVLVVLGAAVNAMVNGPWVIELGLVLVLWGAVETVF